MILPSFYLPPISWFAAFKSGEPIAIEVCENFQKQSLRNRCYIDSPNGKLALSIPVDKSNFLLPEDGKGGSPKCLTKDVRISHQLDWRHQHWQAFETSYFNSPFFEYLQDDFHYIYNKEWKYLVDLNEALIQKCLELLELDNSVSRTNEYQGLTITDKELKVGNTEQKSYYQVFQQKHGFLPNLSILDLLFNMGPEAPLYL